MRGVISALLAVVASSGPTFAAAPIAVSPQAKAATECVYRALKADRTLRPVSAYVIDSFRTAVEVNLTIPSGTLVMQIVLTKTKNVSYSPMTQTDQSGEAIGQELGALDRVYNLVDQGCHIPVGLDHLLPPAKARGEWQRLDLSD